MNTRLKGLDQLLELIRMKTSHNDWMTSQRLRQSFLEARICEDCFLRSSGGSCDKFTHTKGTSSAGKWRCRGLASIVYDGCEIYFLNSFLSQTQIFKWKYL